MAYHLRGNSVYDDEEVREHDAWTWSLWPVLLVGYVAFHNCPYQDAQIWIVVATGAAAIGIVVSRLFRLLLYYVFGTIFLLAVLGMAIGFFLS